MSVDMGGGFNLAYFSFTAIGGVANDNRIAFNFSLSSHERYRGRKVILLLKEFIFFLRLRIRPIFVFAILSDSYVLDFHCIKGLFSSIDMFHFCIRKGYHLNIFLHSLYHQIMMKMQWCLLLLGYTGLGLQWKKFKKLLKPLLFLLRSLDASKYVVLCNIQVFAKVMPSFFAPNIEDFFISSSDAYIKAPKLEILSSIATDHQYCLFYENTKYMSIITSLLTLLLLNRLYFCMLLEYLAYDFVV
ncbi:uncharacterized protein LOC110881449 [Helianthus annuus]|uniref:uncharacterized protein LOC110881449 n=1 Tax=Helianthus annuus TaxID=4232 RepID=UPI000B8FCE24|nr:uncharacterized protein LOC110881449 [Helianthus annuus]